LQICQIKVVITGNEIRFSAHIPLTCQMKQTEMRSNVLPIVESKYYSCTITEYRSNQQRTGVQLTRTQTKRVRLGDPFQY